MAFAEFVTGWGGAYDSLAVGPGWWTPWDRVNEGSAVPWCRLDYDSFVLPVRDSCSRANLRSGRTTQCRLGGARISVLERRLQTDTTAPVLPPVTDRAMGSGRPFLVLRRALFARPEKCDR